MRALFDDAEGTFERVESIKVGPVISDAKPKASNGTVTTDEDTAYTFRADDFGFVVVDAGDTLSSIKMVTLPSGGTLALDGTAVTANQSVTRADIDTGKLVFTPAQNANGAAHASFTYARHDSVRSDDIFIGLRLVGPRIEAGKEGAEAHWSVR